MSELSRWSGLHPASSKGSQSWNISVRHSSYTMVTSGGARYDVSYVDCFLCFVQINYYICNERQMEPNFEAAYVFRIDPSAENDLKHHQGVIVLSIQYLRNQHLMPTERTLVWRPGCSRRHCSAGICDPVSGSSSGFAFEKLPY